MKLEGEDSVLGEAKTGPVGWSVRTLLLKSAIIISSRKIEAVCGVTRIVYVIIVIFIIVLFYYLNSSHLFCSNMKRKYPSFRKERTLKSNCVILYVFLNYESHSRTS